MKEHYALAKELWIKDPWYPRPSDIALDNKGGYHQLLQTSPTSDWLVIKGVQQFSIVRVKRILDARDGELQWKILNK